MLRCDLTLTRPSFALQVKLELEGARFVALVGPSGSGKSTLLRALAGLSREARGSVHCAGELWQDARTFVPTHRRALGFVFQDAGLFAHLNVRENLCFGMARVPAAARRIAFDDVVQLLGITPLLTRRTPSLSGGERQRVALGRALLTSPRVLLFDEPLASLDAESRAQIIPYLAAVQRSLRLPTLYVTHALDEVVRLAEEIVVLEAGQVRRHAPINEALTDPALSLCQHDDAGAALDLAVVRHEPEFHLTELALGSARISVSRRDAEPGERVRVFVRARDVGVSTVAPQHSSVLNVLEAQLLDVLETRDPAHRLLRLEASGHSLLARVTLKAVSQLGLRSGVGVFIQVKTVALTAR